MLPTLKFDNTTTVTVLGTEVTVRALTRDEATDPVFLTAAQAVDGGDFTRIADVEVHLLACGFDVTPDAAREWRATAPAVAVDEITAAVARISGLTQEGQRGPGPGDSP